MAPRRRVRRPRDRGDEPTAHSTISAVVKLIPLLKGAPPRPPDGRFAVALLGLGGVGQVLLAAKGWGRLTAAGGRPGAGPPSSMSTAERDRVLVTGAARADSRRCPRRRRPRPFYSSLLQATAVADRWGATHYGPTRWSLSLLRAASPLPSHPCRQALSFSGPLEGSSGKWSWCSAFARSAARPGDRAQLADPRGPRGWPASFTGLIAWRGVGTRRCLACKGNWACRRSE